MQPTAAQQRKNLRLALALGAVALAFAGSIIAYPFLRSSPVAPAPFTQTGE